MDHTPTLTIISSSTGTAFGGLETYVINEVRHLSARFRISLFTGKGPSTGDFEGLSSLPGGLSYRMLPFISRSASLSLLPSMVGLGGKINSFDVEALSLLPSLLALRKLIGASDLVEVHYGPESFIFPFIGTRARRIIHFHGPWLPPVYNRARRLVDPATDLMVTCSEWSRDEMKRLYGIHGVELVYNGVDEELFAPREESRFNVGEGYDASLPRVGTVGRLGVDKGTDLLVETARTLTGKAEFFAVGPCDDSFMRSMEEAGMTPNFHFLGPLPNGRLPEFYNFIDCFALPSRFEAFGITVLEAMASGTPVVASRTGGIPEIVDDGIDGMLIPPLDRASLAAAITGLIENGSRRMAMAKAAREKVVSRFTHLKTYNALSALYEEELDRDRERKKTP